MTDLRQDKVESLEWVDVDGDRGRLSDDPEEIGNAIAVAALAVTSMDTREQGAVFISPATARNIIDYLSARLPRA